MSVSLAIMGWMMAMAAVLAVWHGGAARRERVTRACHELRGPLTAARLGVESGLRRGELSLERMRAGNLIANAIEHGGGVVDVRTRDAGETVRLEVVDDGCGLPAPVAQITRRARGGRGARGRGLAIATEIAVQHGGRISCAPSERGARLVLELPKCQGATGSDAGA